MSQSTITLTEALRALGQVSTPADDSRLILIPATTDSGAVTISVANFKKVIQALAQAAATAAAPTPQSTVQGTNTNYIYSTGTTTDLPHGVFSAVFKCYQYAGEVRVTHKLWGSTADYSDGNYISSNIPTVNTSSNGVMHRSHYTRLINTTLTESGSTTTEVRISYPNYADGSTKTLTLTPATTAKAGIMTTAQVNQLNSLADAHLSSRVTNLESTEAGKRLAKIESHYRYLGHFDTESAALAALTTLSVCANTELLHAHLTYDDSTHVDNSIILIQSLSGTDCRQIIYNKAHIYHRGIHFTDLNRKEISMQEDWQFLLADRLQWSTDTHKYILSQFGQGFNHTITDPIPLATPTVDGLMTSTDKSRLDQLVARYLTT